MPAKFSDYIYRYLPLIAVGFAVIYLFNIDIDTFEINWPPLILSIGMLLGLFFFRVYIWFLFLKKIDAKITFKICILSRFKFILAKYIPLKLWIHMGAGAVQEKYTDITFIQGTINAISFQIINNLTGFLVGSAGLLIYLKGSYKGLGLFVLISVSIILLFLFSNEREFVFLNWLQRLKLIKKPLNTFSYNLPACADIFLLLLLQWIILGVSYFYFFKSAYFDVDLSVIFFQPLANNIGMISVFTPGGLGVREGFMVFYLSRLGFQLQEATLMAVISRFWFFLVEFIVFIIGVVIEKNMRRAVPMDRNH